jgi:hypothetical protein
MTVDLHTLTNVTLLTLLYIATGQALAHPIVMNVTEDTQFPRADRIRMGILFGVVWPLLLIRVFTLVATDVTRSGLADAAASNANDDHPSHEPASSEGDEATRRDES